MSQWLATTKTSPATLNLKRLNNEILATTGTAQDWWGLKAMESIQGLKTPSTKFETMDPPTHNGLLLSSVLTTLNSAIYSHVHDGASLFRYLLQYVVLINKINKKYTRWNSIPRATHQRTFINNIIENQDPVAAFRGANSNNPLSSGNNVKPPFLSSLVENFGKPKRRKGKQNNNNNFTGNNNNNSNNYKGKGKNHKRYHNNNTNGPNNGNNFATTTPFYGNNFNNMNFNGHPNHNPNINNSIPQQGFSNDYDTYQNTGGPMNQQLTGAEILAFRQHIMGKNFSKNNNRNRNKN